MAHSLVSCKSDLIAHNIECQSNRIISWQRVNDPPLKRGAWRRKSSSRVDQAKAEIRVVARQAYVGSVKTPCNALPVPGLSSVVKQVEGLNQCCGHDKPFQHCRGELLPPQGVSPVRDTSTGWHAGRLFRPVFTFLQPTEGGHSSVA